MLSMLSIVSVDQSRWILKLSTFPICFKSFSNTSFRSKRAVTSLKWSYNQYAECWYNQYVAWYYNHCMRIFDFVVLRLKFLTWASKSRWASPPRLFYYAVTGFPLSWESSESKDIRAMAMSRDIICVITSSARRWRRVVRLASGINFELPSGRECRVVQ